MRVSRAGNEMAPRVRQTISCVRNRSTGGAALQTDLAELIAVIPQAQAQLRRVRRQAILPAQLIKMASGFEVLRWIVLIKTNRWLLPKRIYLRVGWMRFVACT